MMKQYELLLCSGTACNSNNSGKVKAALERELERHNLSQQVEIISTGCRGMCQAGPILKIYPGGTLYGHVTEQDVPELVEEHLVKGRVLQRLLIIPEAQNNEKKHPFFSRQKKIVLKNCGEIDPENIEEYIGRGGYQALAKALTAFTPCQIIDEIKKSGLRGRGGAGFSTGTKWQFAHDAAGTEKYIICNADEGDPGAFMDRSVLEGDPHTVLEGLAIGAYAIGASRGFIYTRAEYPLAVERVKIAIQQARSLGILGKNIFGTTFEFDVEIRMGAGAFVCGEETALIASIEGKRGMPRLRPPYPAQSGLWGKPTNINNVETLANVRHIILNGSKWFRSFGTESSPGTKVFALAGKVKFSGLIEVPMGMSLREVIYDIGGGMKGKLPFKAVQMGGPSGGCIPASLLDTIVDYDSISKTGAIMGSGGMVVMDESTCMVDVARFFLEFTQHESCGKCTFCRIGTKRMLEILTRITEGKGTMDDLDLLEDLADKIQKTSLCGLGQTAPNPVLTTLKYFRDEYIAHIKDKKCPAGSCAALIHYHINPDLCVGCTACARACPTSAIHGTVKQPHSIDQTQCIKCGICYATCRFNAITKE